MRKARKLFLLVVVAVAAMALTASSASAQVEVSDEDSVHCSAVTKVGHHVEGGCELHIVNAGAHVELVSHQTMDVLIADCDNEFRIHVGEDGEGWVDEIEVSLGETSSCGVIWRECRAGDPESGGVDEPWHFQIEEVAEGVEHANVELCLFIQPNFPSHTGSFDLTGHLEMDLTTVGETLVSAEAEDAPITEQSPPPTAIGQEEIYGHWAVEGPSILIHHPPAE